MKTPKVSEKFFGKFDDNFRLAKTVLEFVKKNLVGKKIILDNNLKIELTWQGLKNDVNEYHTYYREKLISFAVLEDILRESIFIRKEKPKNPQKTKEIYKYYSKVKVGRIIFDVIIVIKRTSKTYLYDHILIK